MGMPDRIKERRILANLTQEELAAKLNLQKSAIAKYENGRVENIKRSTIQKMAEILNCTPCYLMGWSDQPNTVKGNSDNFPFTPLEKDLVTHYRAADPTTQGIVRTILKVEDKEEEKGISVS